MNGWRAGGLSEVTLLASCRVSVAILYVVCLVAVCLSKAAQQAASEDSTLVLFSMLVGFPYLVLGLICSTGVTGLPRHVQRWDLTCVQPPSVSQALYS